MPLFCGDDGLWTLGSTETLWTLMNCNDTTDRVLLAFYQVMLWRSFSVEPSHHPFLFISRRVWLTPPPPLTSCFTEIKLSFKRDDSAILLYFRSAFSPHQLNLFMLHFYGNLVFIGVIFFPYLIAFYDYLEPLCVFKTQFVSVFRSTGASFKKEKSSRAVTVKCCRSRCDLDLEHRNNNCTFSIFYFCIFFLHHVWLWFLSGHFPACISSSF